MGNNVIVSLSMIWVIPVLFMDAMVVSNSWSEGDHTSLHVFYASAINHQQYMLSTMSSHACKLCLVV